MRGPFSEAEFLDFLREAGVGTSAQERRWDDFVSHAMFRAWKLQYGKVTAADTNRLKQVELENARLKKALAHANNHILRLRAETRGAARHAARSNGQGA